VTSPFELLGLAASAEVTDDDVRGAWRRVAAATHPDRADGGDPAGFAAAAAAYTQLRTPAARAEALADLLEPGRDRVPDGRVPVPNNALARIAANAAWRVGHGRPLRLAGRLLATAAAAVLAVAAVGWQPASGAVVTGALTWLLLTARADLAAAPRIAIRRGRPGTPGRNRPSPSR
jgi:curved DNA-binding protein CbpA